MSFLSRKSKDPSVEMEQLKKWADKIQSSYMGESLMGAHTHGYPWSDPFTGKINAIHLLAMRLHLKHGEPMPFDHIDAYVDGDKAFVFIVNKGEAVTLADDGNLFPSDALITKINLMRG